MQKLIAGAKILALLCLMLSFSSSAAAFSPPHRLQNFYNYLRQTASETLSFDEKVRDKWTDRLQNLQLQKNIQNSLQKLKDAYEGQKQQQKHKYRHEKAVKRNFLEKLGESRINNSDRTLNDYAREILQKTRPDLIGTDYYNNPARAISYFILVDPRGFIENIKIIRGPLDTPMTLKEAYEFYSRTDPQKAEKILNMLESLQKLYMPDSDQNPADTILESVGQTIELLNSQSE